MYYLRKKYSLGTKFSAHKKGKLTSVQINFIDSHILDYFFRKHFGPILMVTFFHDFFFPGCICYTFNVRGRDFFFIKNIKYF